MLYLVLKRDLERISLARKHVLSADELDNASSTIRLITDGARYRISSLRSKFGIGLFRLGVNSLFVGIFEQQNLDVKDQLGVFAQGLVRLLTPHQKIRISRVPYSTTSSVHAEPPSSETNSESCQILPLAETR